MKTARREDALLAGVCADIAGRFGWNVWALRALFVVFLLVKTLWAVVAYAALAVMFRLIGAPRPAAWNRPNWLTAMSGSRTSSAGSGTLRPGTPTHPEFQHGCPVAFILADRPPAWLQIDAHALHIRNGSESIAGRSESSTHLPREACGDCAMIVRKQRPAR